MSFRVAGKTKELAMKGAMFTTFIASVASITHPHTNSSFPPSLPSDYNVRSLANIFFYKVSSLPSKSFCDSKNPDSFPLLELSQLPENFRKVNLPKYFDHTILKSDASISDVLQVCHEAKTYNFASVCVNSSNVPLVFQELRGTGTASFHIFYVLLIVYTFLPGYTYF